MSQEGAKDLAVKDTDMHLNCAVGNLSHMHCQAKRRDEHVCVEVSRKGRLQTVVLTDTSFALQSEGPGSNPDTNIYQLYILRQVSSFLQSSVSSAILPDKVRETAGKSWYKDYYYLVGLLSKSWQSAMACGNRQFLSSGEIRGSEHFHAKQDLSEAQIYALSYGAISTTLC